MFAFDVNPVVKSLSCDTEMVLFHSFPTWSCFMPSDIEKIRAQGATHTSKEFAQPLSRHLCFCCLSLSSHIKIFEIQPFFAIFPGSLTTFFGWPAQAMPKTVPMRFVIIGSGGSSSLPNLRHRRGHQGQHKGGMMGAIQIRFNMGRCCNDTLGWGDSTMVHHPPIWPHWCSVEALGTYFKRTLAARCAMRCAPA